jgi:two-component system LytT family response regulator
LYNVRQTDSSMQKVGIPVLGGLDFITVSDIILCKSEDTCTDFYLTDKRKITATKTLKWVDELMREHNFFRVHDSYLVNLNHIKKYKKGGEGGVVELTDKNEADVARRRKEDFFKALSGLNMILNK